MAVGELVRVVLDTNVIYSALREGGVPHPDTGRIAPPGRIVAWAQQGLIQHYVSDPLLREHERVLMESLDEINTRRRWLGLRGLRASDISSFLDAWTEKAALVGIVFSTRPAMEGAAAADEMVLELTAGSGALLITGNRKHFEPMVRPYRIRLMTPGEFTRAMS